MYCKVKGIYWGNVTVHENMVGSLQNLIILNCKWKQSMISHSNFRPPIPFPHDIWRKLSKCKQFSFVCEWGIEIYRNSKLHLSLLILQHVSVFIYKNISRNIAMTLHNEQKLMWHRSPVALSPIMVIWRPQRVGELIKNDVNPNECLCTLTVHLYRFVTGKYRARIKQM